MKLFLQRKLSNTNNTLGELFIDGIHQCFTLEDVVREVKIPKVTAIPQGTYKVILNVSNRFKRVLPLLIDVPNFSGVRIHNGNREGDTDGCILVGKEIGDDGKSLKNSNVALFELLAKLSGQTITIEIVNFKDMLI